MFSCSMVTFVLCLASRKYTKFAKLTSSNLFCLHHTHFAPTSQFESEGKYLLPLVAFSD